jgi:hypothetical protein
MNDVTQPASMVGAGMPEDVDEQQMMSLLPSSPLPMAPPIAGPNPGLAAGSGILSALQGQAYNPYLQGQQKSADSAAAQQQGAMRTMGFLQQNQLAAQAQQMRMMEMKRRAEEAKKSEKLRTNEARYKLVDMMLKHSDENVRLAGGKEFVGLAKETGLNVDPALAEGFARKAFTHQNIQDAARYIKIMPLENVQQLTGVPLRVLQNLADPQNQQSDAFSMMATGKSLAELDKQKIDVRKAEQALVKGDYPETDTPLGIEASVIAQQMFKVPIGALSVEDRGNVLALAKKNLEQKELEKAQREQQYKLQLEREKEAAKAREKVLGDKDLTAAQKSVVDNITASEAIIDSVKKDIKNLKSIAGPFERYTTGPLHRYYDINMQNDPAAAAAQSRIEGSLAKLIRAMGEVGTLTDQDIARARRLWPVLTLQTELRGPFGGVLPVFTFPDTDATANKKFSELIDLLKEIKTRTGLPRGAVPFKGDINQLHQEITGKPMPGNPLTPEPPAQTPTVPGKSPALSESQTKALRDAGYTPEQIEAYKKAKGMQ